MSSPSKDANSEASQKTIEDLSNEIKKLKTQINSLSDDIDLLKVDKQMKEFKITILEKKLNLQDEQIRLLQDTLKKQSKNREDKTKEEDKNKKIEENKNEDDEKMNIKYKKDITNDAPSYTASTQMFCVFKSLKGKEILSWVTKKKTIELYDLEKESSIKSIKDGHSNDIHCVRHFIDTKTNTDLLITCSFDKSIKVWNVEEMDKPLLTIENAHANGYIFSPCILSHEKLNENYIISGADEEGIKVFEFKENSLGKHIKIEEYMNFIDTYYNKKENKFYIINGNSRNLVLFNFDDLSLYKTYVDRETTSHAYIIVYEDEKNNQVQLLDSDMKGFINIWDFYSGDCLKRISVKTIVSGICLWDDQYVIATGKDKTIKIVDFKEGKVIRSLVGHNKETISVRKIHISKYGDCLVSHGKDGLLKLWSF